MVRKKDRHCSRLSQQSEKENDRKDNEKKRKGKMKKTRQQRKKKPKEKKTILSLLFNIAQRLLAMVST